jgi:thiopeptide-type bacteriocin biosynthesis protein
MRAAGLDLEEQGDVWATIAALRADTLSDQLAPDRPTWIAFTDAVRRLVLGAPRVDKGWESWRRAFINAGETLTALRSEGTLQRGLRAVIAKNLIFHWNRLGVSASTQAVIAQAAKESILGRA